MLCPEGDIKPEKGENMGDRTAGRPVERGVVEGGSPNSRCALCHTFFPTVETGSGCLGTTYPRRWRGETGNEITVSLASRGRWAMGVERFLGAGRKPCQRARRGEMDVCWRRRSGPINGTREEEEEAKQLVSSIFFIAVLPLTG